MGEKQEYTGLEIAIIGMSGRFPGANDLKTFWDNLKNGVESISFITDEELLKEGEDQKVINDPLYIKANAFVKGKEYFDSNFFNYTPHEAELMDPQMRVFHQCVWEAIEDAGCNLNDDKNKIGLFAGASGNVNWQVYSELINTEGLVDDFTAFQLSNARFLSSKLSYFLNLKGPSIFLDTACSTSLVAIHQACRSLLLADCNVAIAGGVTIRNRSKKGHMYTKGMIHSQDGHCRAFDEKASGTVTGEGAAVVVLKTLKNALKDGDHIYAIVKGSGVNNDGNHKVGYTAPSVDGQIEAIMMAHKWAKIEPATVGLIEAHGTATELGDPIEVEALNRAFGTSNTKYCALGSVKTNIGHLDIAAGATGFIKAVLALKNRQIPPSLHYTVPNPKINFVNTPFYVNTELREWRNGQYPLRAGVSSFGIGGTNAHLILEEAPVQEASSESRDYQILIFSAKTPIALEKNIDKFQIYFKENTGVKLSDIAYTLKVGRSAFPYRKMIVCRNHDEAVDLLKANAAQRKLSDAVSGKIKYSTVFMFSGQGSQYPNMYAGIYKQESLFKAIVDDCCLIVEKLTGKDLKSIIFDEEKIDKSFTLNSTRFTQPSLFIMEYALARLFMSWGVKPSMMIGHSIGEYVAACLSDVFSLEDALSLVVKRGELMQKTQKGSMLSISISEHELQPFLKPRARLSLAAVNSSELCVVSGNETAIADFKTEIEKHGYKSNMIRTSHAFHSAMMDDILDEFEKEVTKIKLSSPKIPFISNLSGEPVTAHEISKPAYWVNHLRQTVRFAKGIEGLLKKEHVLFIEIGPGTALSTFVRTNKLRGKEHKVIALVKHPQDNESDINYLLRGLGEVWLNGIEPNWDAFYKDEIRKKVSLPTYSFEEIKYPVHVDAHKMISDLISENTLTKNQDLSKWYYKSSWKLSPLITNEIKVASGETTLILIDEDTIGNLLINKFKAHQDKYCIVRTGECFNEKGVFEYEINPSQPAGYEELFRKLSEQNFFPNCIIHAWGITGGEEESLSEKALEKYLYSIPALVQASLKSEGGFSNKRIVLLTSGVHSILDTVNISLAKTMPQGLMKVLSQEFPSVDSSYIDISSSEEINEDYISKLYTELQDKKRGKTVSLRHGRRWEKIYDEIQVDNQKPYYCLREGGVYLITGGLGKLGLTLAEQLLKRFKAKVILIGRTPLPKPEGWHAYLSNKQADADIKQKIISIQNLKKEAGEVLYIEANVADFKQISKAVNISEKRFGSINGVIHAAGITVRGSSKTISELIPKDFKEQFESKITGLQVLKDVFGKKEIDFCFVTSSISSVLGGIKFGAYITANTFVDYYIKTCIEKGELKNWVSANLDSLDFNGSPSNAINGEELFEVFQQILSLKNVPQVIVSISNLHQRLDKWVYQEFFSQKGGSIVDNLTFLNEEDRLGYAHLNATERPLVQLWEKFFGKPAIGLDDDFFELGGDSLKALTMIGRIYKMFNTEIAITEFFKRSSIRELSKYIISLKQHADSLKLGTVNDYLPIPNAAIKAFYKLSSTQRRQYFLYEFDKQSLSYNQVQLIRLEGKIDYENLTNAFVRLIERHEILRTSFKALDEELVQKVEEHISFNIEQFKSDEENVPSIIKDFIRPFDLAFPPIIRVGLIEIKTHVHILMVDIHHIATDGVSQNILINDFMSFYMHKELPPLSLQYRDYAEWQQSVAQQNRMVRQKDFWLNEFPEEPAHLELPIDFPRPAIKSYEGNVQSFNISEEETRKLKLIAEKEGVTMFMVLLSIYNILLSKIANREEIVIGTPASGRQHPDLENILGMFINMLPLRNYPKGNMTFKRFLSTVKTRTLACFDNQAYPYEALIDELKINRNTSRNPLFEAVFSYENFGNAKFEIPDVVLSPYDYDRSYSKFDILLMAIDGGDRFSFHFEYSTALFEPSTVHKIITAYKEIIAQIVNEPEIKLSEIEIVSKFEKELLLKEFNHTDVHFSSTKTVIDIFEEQVEKFPQSIAVVCNGIGISYAELNERSNQLSHFLIEKGAKPNVIVALVMDKSIEMVVSIVSILKSGAAYLPIDIESPREKIKQLIRDCRPLMLFTTNDLKEKSNEEIPRVFIENLLLSSYDKTNPVVIRPTDSLCYIIYTSGTTGKPKGVMVDHANLMSLISNDAFYFNFNSSDVWTMFHRYCFDFSVWEMYGALLFGGKLIIISKQDSLDPSSFLEILKKNSVTVLNQTPTAFNNLIQQERLDTTPLLKLRYVIFGGEALNPKMLSNWKNRYPDVKLVNMFGITETTVHVTYKEITQQDILSNISNIGKPLPTLSTYVLDANLNIVPRGFTGELYVGGKGVSRGYINDVELTHERFLEHNPYQKGDRIYKSGDLVRVDKNGDLEYKGRMDDQIQLKGFRIELGEIENALTKYRFINEARVVYKERNAEPFLVAYYVADRHIESSHIRRVLSEWLPSYMVPAYFVKIEQIPLTVNGKADVRMLPEPEVITSGTYVQATTQNEIMLTEIWAKVLSISKIGIEDNFFAVGGDSIIAIRLINKINDNFNLKLKIIDLYSNQTIRGLSSFIETLGLADGTEANYDEVLRELEAFHEGYVKNKPDCNIEVVYPMSNIEKGMCYVQMKHEDEVLYYEQIVWPIYYENFKVDLVRKAVTLLTQKHSALRTAFDLSTFAHIIYREIDVEIPFLDISNLPEIEQQAVIDSNMKASRTMYLKLDTVPLWKMSIYKLDVNVHILIFDNHHAISDGWTIATFSNELNALYNQLTVDAQFVPEMLKSSYKDFIVQEILYEKNSENIEYWKTELEGFKKLSFGINNNSKVYKTLNKPIDKDLYHKIEKLALLRNSSVKNIFFAAYIYTLKALNFTNDIVVGLVTFNRSIGEDGDKVFGNFLNTTPVRVKVDQNINSQEFLDVIDKKLLEVKRYDRSSLFSINKALGAREYGENPITDTLFNYTNFHSSYELRLENVRNESLKFKVGNYIKGNSLFDVNVNGDIDELFISYAYVLSFIDDFLVDKFHNLYLNVLNFFTESYTAKLSFESVTEKYELALLSTFNDTDAEFPADQTVVDIFMKTASRFCDDLAVVSGEGNLSYYELDKKSTKLANYINSRGIKSNTIVGISVERSLHMVIGILGILKANCAYLPIDPNNPRMRNRYLLQDTNVELLLSQRKFSANIGELVDTLYLEDLDSLPEEDNSGFNYASDPDALAYVIYTSGSTGKPKGVAINHKAVVNRLHWMQESYPIDQDDIILQKTPFTFDVSVWELFWWFFKGGKLVMLEPNAEKEPEQLIHTIETNQVTVIHFVPSMLTILLNRIQTNPDDIYRLKSLRYVFASGEALMPGHANLFNELFSSHGIKLVNLYGPTEATVDVTYFNCDVQGELLLVPIGKPINNIKIYVLDVDLNLLPIGIVGELYIGGVGLGRGYINQAELTAERFIINPFNKTEILYKTGDMGKWLTNGNIEYIGRADDQVKIRGNRVELGEIQQVLLNISGIDDCVVVSNEVKTEIKIIAFYTSKQSLSPLQLKGLLRKTLPEYMIPYKLTQIQQIPLMPNGKANRKELVELCSVELEQVKSTQEPSSKIEKEIAELWIDEIGVEKISIDDVFFDIGGHSLSAIKTASKMKNKYGIEPNFADFFNQTFFQFVQNYEAKLNETDSLVNEQDL